MYIKGKSYIIPYFHVGEILSVMYLETCALPPQPPLLSFWVLTTCFCMAGSDDKHTEMEGVHGARKVGTLCGVGVGAGVG